MCHPVLPLRGYPPRILNLGEEKINEELIIAGSKTMSNSNK
jgi:hypothetical protein